MSKVVLMGECMVELLQSTNGLQQSFAGDVYNTGVYLRRSFPQHQVSLLSAVGKDELSDQMLRRFQQEALNTQWVFRHQTKIPGIYRIQTDETGERSFLYWRNDSAAKQTMRFVDEQITSQLSSNDLFFFSGISLAVLAAETRDSFWQTVNQLKEAGVKIVFDPNYRARLWSNIAETKEQYEIALNAADVVMPGIEDFTDLYGLSSFKAVQAFCAGYDIEELIIKDGPNGVFYQSGEQSGYVEIEPVKQVVDTTSAGDSFNGVYLGARLQGDDIELAISKASDAAAFVIQHKGAIVDKSAYSEYWQQQQAIQPV